MPEKENDQEIKAKEQGNLLLKFRQLVNQNPKIAIALSLVIILLAGVIIIRPFLDRGQPAVGDPGAPGEQGQGAGVPGDGEDDGQPEEAEVLPQPQRGLGEDKGTPRDPFAGPLELVGVLLAGSGRSLAIIEAEDASYVAGEGEIVAGSWRVEEIHRDYVLLKSGSQGLTLYLPGSQKPLPPGPLEEDFYTEDLFPGEEGLDQPEEGLDQPGEGDEDAGY